MKDFLLSNNNNNNNNNNNKRKRGMAGRIKGTVSRYSACTKL